MVFAGLSSRPATELCLATTMVLAGVGTSALVAQPTSEDAALPPVLVSYDFDRHEPSGPDTFRLFERPAGSVDLSTSFRVSGERSLRLSEGRRDGSFSEFLGFFEECRTGAVYVQFYFLLTDPEERFNFALAGTRWFLSYEQHGHAFWLATRGGELVHQSAGEWRALFVPRAFTWYFVDLVYDVDAGAYDLAIYAEGSDRPVVDLHEQRNTADQSASSIRYYSFIGDLEDEDQAMIYVDDLLIATDSAVRLHPFVAPGRRSFFVDRFAPSRPALTRNEREDLVFEARQLVRGVSTDASSRSSASARAVTRFGIERLERAADEAFHAQDWVLAEEIYRLLQGYAQASGGGIHDERLRGALASRVLLKLSDVHHQRGDVEAERLARELIYGRLELEELSGIGFEGE